MLGQRVQKTFLFSFCFWLLALREADAAKTSTSDDDIAIAARPGGYEIDPQQIPDSWDDFEFGRCQSPQAVKQALSRVRRHSLKPYKGRDGRHGLVASTVLGGDYVLAESEQTAIQCTAKEVLSAYLSGALQKRWNPTQVLDCTITRREDHEAYYQQDLVLHSQRVLTTRTGIMRYSQRICIDNVGEGSYCVSIKLDPSVETTTIRKPFEKLSVYVALKEEGPNVSIYAAGIMKVNRKVVPSLLVFDCSGIAGSMAGKGTLWLAAHFTEKRRLAEKWLSSRGVRSQTASSPWNRRTHSYFKNI